MAEVADPEEGLRVESASRLDWDRDRWLRRPLNAVVNPVKADSDFMSRLLFLLRKVIQSSMSALRSLQARKTKLSASAIGISEKACCRSCDHDREGGPLFVVYNHEDSTRLPKRVAGC